MATKAEQFRYEAERQKPKRAARPAPLPKRRDTADGGALNLSRRGGKKATVTTEASLSGKRSRKASRSSAHHGKNSTVLEYASRLKNLSPRTRHERR